MKTLTPYYSKRVVLIQTVTIIIFSLALYFFLHFMEEEKKIKGELTAMASQRQQLEQVQGNISRYMEMIKTDTALQAFESEPIWEEVEFHWQDIPLPELLARLESLDRHERIFVLKSFKTEIKRVEGETTGKERFHHVRGYFLCPLM